MKIIGVGAGPGMLSMEAAKAIEQAEIVYGSQRAIELAATHINCEIRFILIVILRSSAAVGTSYG